MSDLFSGDITPLMPPTLFFIFHTPGRQCRPSFLCYLPILRNTFRMSFNGSYHSRDQGAAVVIWCPFIIWPQRALSVRISHAASVTHNINHPHRTPDQKNWFSWTLSPLYSCRAEKQPLFWPLHTLQFYRPPSHLIQGSHMSDTKFSSIIHCIAVT